MTRMHEPHPAVERRPTDRRPTILLLMGPTASGKTDLAMALRERLDAELVSVDSAMVYRGMDIGTAKPSAEELERAPHRLIDIRDPADPYSAAEFRDDARQAIDEILAAGRLPLLVGGTMLYFRSLLGGMGELPAADPAVRAELEAWAARDGLGALHAELARVDAESAARIHPNDPQRLLRALEVQRLSGRPMSALWREQQAEPLPWRVIPIGLAPADRAVLHRRIAARFEAMLAAGFLDEVRALKCRGDLHADLPAIKSVGYRQAWMHLDGRLSAAELHHRGVVATRQLAKRQLTWLRSWPGLQWIDATAADPLGEALKIVRRCST